MSKRAAPKKSSATVDAPHCMVCHEMTATEVQLHGTFSIPHGLCKRCYTETLTLLQLCGERGMGILASSQFTPGTDYPNDTDRWNGTGTGTAAPVPNMSQPGAQAIRNKHEKEEHNDDHDDDDGYGDDDDANMDPSRTLKGSPARKRFDDDGDATNRDVDPSRTLKGSPFRKTFDDDGDDDDDEINGDVDPSRTLKGSPARKRFDDDDDDEHSTIKKAPNKKSKTNKSKSS